MFEIYDAAFEKCKISHCNGQTLDPHASVKGKVRPKKQMVSEKHHSPSGADHQEQVFSAHKQSTQRSSSNGPKLGSDKSDCPESGSVPNYRVKVIAENKQTCIKARNAFYQKIKDKFLQEEIVERTQKISQEAKQKITKIITTNHIKAIKSKFQRQSAKGYFSNCFSYFQYKYLKKEDKTCLMQLYIIFVCMDINQVALSISLHCNVGKNKYMDTEYGITQTCGSVRYLLS